MILTGLGIAVIVAALLAIIVAVIVLRRLARQKAKQSGGYSSGGILGCPGCGLVGEHTGDCSYRMLG